MSVNEIIEWLRSPEGEKWSLDHSVRGGNATRHEPGIFGSVKPDIEHGASWALYEQAFEMNFRSNSNKDKNVIQEEET